MNLQQKINHNQNFSEFSETEAITLKKVASFFQDTIHFHPGHLQPKTPIVTIRALGGKNSRFCQNSLTYRNFGMVIFRFLGQNGLKLELCTLAVHNILMEH